MLTLRVVSRSEYYGDLVEFTKSDEGFLVAYIVGNWLACPNRAAYRAEAETIYATRSIPHLRIVTPCTL